MTSAARGLAQALRSRPALEILDWTAVSASHLVAFDADPESSIEVLQALKGTATEEALERLMQILPGTFRKSFARSLNAPTDLPKKTVSIIEPMSMLHEKLEVAEAAGQTDLLILRELLYYRLLLLSRNVAESTLSGVGKNIELLRSYATEPMPSKPMDLEVDVSQPVGANALAFDSWKRTANQSLFQSVSSILNVLRESPAGMSSFRRELAPIASRASFLSTGSRAEANLSTVLNSLFPEPRGARPSIAYSQLLMESGYARGTPDLLPVLGERNSELRRLLTTVLDGLAEKTPQGKKLLSGEPLKKVVIITHPVAVEPNTYRNYQGELAAYLIRNTAFSDAPILTLISTGHPVLNADLANRTALFRYSQVGELLDPPIADEVHLMGGAMSECLENSLEEILADHFLRRPGKTITVYVHMDFVYQFFDSESFEVMAASELANPFSVTETPAAALWGRFFGPQNAVKPPYDGPYLEWRRMELHASRFISPQGPSIRFSLRERHTGETASVILMGSGTKAR